jgi:hypothetical protein
MKRLLPAALALAAATAAAAQSPFVKPRAAKAGERAAAVSVIQAQLKAFGRDDYKAAVTYQSAGLRRTFPSTQAFRAMMLRTYPQFAHARSVAFGPAQCDPSGAHLAIRAVITGQDGVAVRAVYLLVREGKAYRVEGVAGGAQPPPDLGGPAQDV